MDTPMRTSREPAHLLRAADLDHDHLEHLLRLAEAMKERPNGWRDRHPGETVACYFAKPSTRTRVSFEAAAQRLGILPVMLRPDELQLGRGETIADTARVLSSFCAAIVIRTFAQRDVEELAAASSVPVANALTDDHHPCQALADLLTLRELHGDVRGLQLAYLGDGANVAHSLLEAGAIAGMRVSVATPRGYEPDPKVVAEARRLADSPHDIEITHDPYVAVAGADAVYTDVWASMGEEDEAEVRRTHLAPYRVTVEMMESAGPHAVFMHCLPAHRGEEVEADVIDGERSVVFRQAANRLPTEQALLHTLISGDWLEG